MIENIQTIKNKKKIQEMLKKLEEIDRKIYLMNEQIASIKNDLRDLKWKKPSQNKI